ncbi:hypothetical protein GMOD_00005370 [Pyrenophora seminiperda CCB06]|uniref:Uncharacterized protein n=1 Tax=Pyrenophora seminiperda CCB06 TaxID=1302712 RepID=A0A3M7LVW8_9PLEO|nr:hypothetical protein GMOD_00005370 [Pyrenophora seminiperda CCB06]
MPSIAQIVCFVFVFFFASTVSCPTDGLPIYLIEDPAILAELAAMKEELKKIQGHVTPVMPAPLMALTFFFIFFSTVPARLAAAFDKLVEWAKEVKMFPDNSPLWERRLAWGIAGLGAILEPFRLGHADAALRITTAETRARDADKRAASYMEGADARIAAADARVAEAEIAFTRLRGRVHAAFGAITVLRATNHVKITYEGKRN